MAGGHRPLAQEPTSTSPARSRVPSSMAAMVTSSYALAPSPCYACLGSHTVARRRRPGQQPAAARGTASRADGGSRRAEPASGGLPAARSRPCGRPTAARSWLVAGKRRACRGQRRPASLRPARGCHSFSRTGHGKWWRAPQNLGTALALGAKSCDKQLASSVFSLIHLNIWECGSAIRQAEIYYRVYFQRGYLSSY